MSFQWPGYVPWKEPRPGNYTDQYPTHFSFAPAVERVAKSVINKFPGVSINTYHRHPPPAPQYERVSLDVWGARGRGDRLDPAIGQKVFDYLFSLSTEPNIEWAIYRGSMWVRGEGWHPSPPGPGDSDPRHDYHIHISYGLKYDIPKDQGPVSKFMPGVPVKWYQAHSDNFTIGRGRAIDRVVLHVTGGSFNSAVNTFQNGANQVSTHYLIRSSDGHVGQLVSELNTGWHAGSWNMNQRSIGVEHEAVKGQPGYLTDAMLSSSTKLVADICKRHNISPDGQHIIFHREATATECPTPFWDKGRYIQLVREKMVSTPTPPAEPNDSLFGPVRFSREQAVAATQAIYPDANMVWVRAAARNIYALKSPSYISPDRRFAQFLLETGAGKYGGDSVWPNMAGIKKGPKERGGTVEDEPIDFLVPRNAFAGALIQANHWCAYTKTPLPRNADPVHERYWVAKSVTESKPAVTRISQTGSGVWATDSTYAKKWRDLIDRLAAHSTAKEIDVSEPQNQPVGADSHGPSNSDAPDRSLTAEPVLWGTAAKSIVTLFAIVSSAYGVDVASDVQEALVVLLGVALPALAALIGIGVAERQSVTPVAKKRR